MLLAVSVVASSALGTSLVGVATAGASGGTPTVTAVSPGTATAITGTLVTVTGTNLTGATAVDFGPVPASGIDVTSATQLTAVAPAGVGTVTVTVTTTDGTSATTSADHFTYPSGELWGWGTDGNDQLADGSTTNATSPVKADGLGPLAQVSSGHTTTLALAPTGHVHAWGQNTAGQLGNGTTTDSTTPVEVEGVGGSGDLSGVVAVAEGEDTSYALASTGHLYAWGNNGDGQLGNGSTTGHVTTPVEVEGVGGSGDLSGVVAVAAGDDSALALATTGHLYAWGGDTSGQLGVGTLSTTRSRTPLEVEGVGGSGDLSGVVAIAAGGSASYALTATGHLYSWGTNSNGQLGDGTTTNRTTPVEVVGVGDTGDLSGLVGINAGGGTSMALSSAGHVYTWGTNKTGQLGDGSTATQSATPVEVVGVGGTGVLSGIVAVAGSGNADDALSTAGNAYAWGADTDGQLGDGTTTNRTTPLEVKGPGGTGDLGAALAIDAGGDDAFALTTYPTVTALSPTTGPDTGGTSVTVTGTNLTGTSAVDFGLAPASAFTVDSATQLTATAPATDAGTVTVTVTTKGGTSPTSSADRFTFTYPTPTVTALSPSTGPVGGGTSVTITGTGFSGATAVTFGTTAAASFTVDSATQITATSPAGTGTVTVTVTTPGGTSTTGSADHFTYLATPTVTGVSPSTGTFVAGTTVTVTGTNLTGATAVHFGPVPATGITVTSSTQITAIAPAGVGTVTVTVTTPYGTSATTSADHFTYPSGELLEWGAALTAQGTTPQVVPGIGPVSAVAESTRWALALTPTGHVYSWGANGTGQLGDGTTTASTTPVEVEGVGGTGYLSDVVAVAVDWDASYALTSTGHVYAWGGASTGALGNGSTTSSTTPVEVEGVGGAGDLSNVVSITVGEVNVLALTATGHVYAWGYGGTGQLGDGSTTTSAVPVAVDGVGGTGDLSDVVAISAGDWDGYAVTATGAVDAWGTNGSGQLGDGTTTGSTTPVEVKGVGGSGLLSGIVAVNGGDGIPLALASDGHVYAWGWNGSGGLGDGTTTNNTTPVEVEGVGGTGDLSDIVAVAGNWTSSYALSDTGHVYAWGANATGQLGDNSTAESTTPVEVDGPGGTGDLSDALAISGGFDDSAYALTAPPTVTALSPTTGPDAGGTSVTITGTRFTGTTAVDFGATPSPSFTVTSTTTITATSPPGTGTVTVVVTGSGGTSATSSADQFTYTLSAPAVTALTPSSGSTTGGTTVTITGVSFTGTTAVTFGTTPAASFTVTGTTTLTATSPAGTGTVAVTVTNAHGTSAASSADHFTYHPAPAVTAVSPSTGTFVAGTTVTVTGTNLTGATAVHFGQVPATGITVTSATQLTAVAPAGVGTVTVTATTPGGTSATSSADQFTYPTGELLGWGTNSYGQLGSGNPSRIDTPTAIPDIGQVAAVASGYVSTVALSPTGHVFSWGENNYGQLGDGTTTSSSTPVEVEGVGGTGVLSNVVGVAAGGATSYALASTGHVYAWGQNYDGQLGDGTTATSSTPVEVEGVGGTGDLTDVVAITAGLADGYAVTTTGHVYEWGTNAIGQLGDGTILRSATPVEVKGVGGSGYLSQVVAIAAGASVSYALAATGGVFAWGDGTTGQLGDGSTAMQSTPVQVEGVGGSGHLSDIVSIGAMRLSAVALSSEGDVYTWGTGHQGQLGNGTTTNSSIPVEVSGPSGTTGPLSGVVAVGSATTSGYVLTATGHLYAWGGNTTGQLGNGTTTPSSIPVEVRGMGGTGPLSRDLAVSASASWRAYAVVAPPTITALSPTTGPDAGGTSVTITGTRFTGTTAVDFGTTPSPSFTVTSTTTITATSPVGTGTVTVVVTGSGGTSAASSADQFVYTLSAPAVTGLTPSSGSTTGGTSVTVTGVAFTGTTAVTFGTTPAASFTVAGTTTITATAPAGTGTVTVTVTNAHGTSATSSADHFTYYPTPTVTGVSPSTGTFVAGTTVTVTGTNLTGATAVHFGPVPATGITVTSATQLTAVAPAGVGTVTVTVTTPGGTSATSSADHFTYPSGELVGWGQNTIGQLDNGTTSNSSPPTSVAGLGAVSAVAAGTATALALTPTGHVYAWGWNSYGSLGNGTTATSSTPVEVEGVGGTGALSNVVAVAAGGYSSYALTSTGHVYAWGADTSGQLGDGTTTYSGKDVPVEVEGVGGTGFLSGVVTISAGGGHVLALMSTGTVDAWGRNCTGDLGDGSSYITSSTPVTVEGVGGSGTLSGIVALAAGAGDSYALASTGAAYAWGTNNYGQLGDGSTASSVTPVNVAGPGGSGNLSNVVALAVSGETSETTYALTKTGTVYVWGEYGTDDFGNGSSTNSSVPVEVKNAEGSGPLSGIDAITAGRYDALALTSTGYVYAWGADTYGQLGNGTTTNSPSPVEVEGPGGAGSLADVLAIAGGCRDAYALTTLPTVTDVSPTTGPDTGGTTVTITGTGFTGATAVTFGSTAAPSYTVESPTQITATAPAGAVGTVAVTVTTSGGTSPTSTADQFTYTLTAPTVTGVSPAAGPLAGGTTVTITGVGFTGATAVTFGSTAATSYTVDSTTTITATAPTGTGTVHVTVTNSLGTSATSSADEYAYEAGPAVTAVSPSTGTFVAGTTVTVTGTNLTGATAVHFGQVPATGITVTSATQLTAVAPAGVGTVTVTATTPGGTSATSSADHFTYPSGQLQDWGTNYSGQLGDGTTTESSTPIPVTGLGPVSMVASGTATTVALTPTGHVYAWGYNYNGQLGDGTTTESPTPVEVEGVGGSGDLSGVVAVAAGDDTGYALTSTGHVYAWGANGTGQLGDGNTTASSTPVEVVGVGGTGQLSGVVAVAGGENDGYALTSTGNVYAWGANGTGQLGDGTTTASSTPMEVVGVGGSGHLSGVVSIAAGINDTTALTSTGNVYAWGDGSTGQLGDGTTATSSTPVEVKGVGGSGHLSGVVSIAAEAWSNLALTVTGHVYGWGTNYSGKLGDGATTNSSTPVEVKGVGGTGVLTDIVAVAPGRNSGYALASTGHVYAWGQNGTGQLGDGTTASSSIPVEVEGLGGTGSLAHVVGIGGGSGWDAYALATPPTVTALSPATGPDVGGTSVTITGTRFTGTTAVTFGTTPASSFTVTSTTTVTATSPVGTGTVTVTVTGSAGTSAASSADQFTYVAGAPAVTALTPSSGSTAGGTTVAITGVSFTGTTAVTFGTTPAASFTVTSTTTVTATAPAGTGTVTVTVTNAHGTSATSSADHFTYYPTPTVTGVSPSTGTFVAGTMVTVTGTNLTGTTAVHFGPVPATGITVTSATQLTAIAPAGVGTVTVTVTTPSGTSVTTSADRFTYPSGDLVGWGENDRGQLVSGDPTTIETPVAIPGLGQVSAVAAGRDSTAALKPTGHVYAWGTNTYGQLGNGTTSSSSTPVEVQGVDGTGVLSNVVAIAAGLYTDDALGSTGHVYTWGTNDRGQLGDGTTTASSTPVEVEGVGGSGVLSNVVAIAAGPSESYAVTATGRAYAWGTNGEGQLGDGGTANSTAPVEVEGVGGSGYLAHVVAMAAASSAAYALSSTGHVYAWGYGGTGRLGDGSRTTSAAPVEVKGVGGSGHLSGVVSITSTNWSALALGANGHAYAWGADYAGQLGDGSSSASDIPVEVSGPAGTTGPLSGIVAVSADRTSFGALSATGSVYEWGANNEGQLGDGTATGSSIPVVVKGIGGTGFLAHSLGIGGSQWWSAFAIVLPPTVTALSPATGPDAGGTSVTITGTRFTGTTAVDFGTTPSPSFTVTSTTTITATSPPGTGTVTVVVTTAAGTSAISSADQFVYTLSAPAVTGLTPSSGSTTGGTSVTITGVAFTGTTAVTFGTTPAASFTVTSTTTITATAPAGTGTVTVTVTNAHGTSATSSADHFTYYPPPTVTGVSPSTGTFVAGTTVTITGTNLTGTTAVHFGPVPATGITVTSSTQLTAVAPAGVGMVTVTVTTLGGTSATSSADHFTYPSGKLVGWGANYNGQLGGTNPTRSSIPETISGVGQMSAVASGDGSTLALTPTGHVYAWGTNTSGHLGNGTTTSSSTPVEVEGVGGTGVLSGIVAVAAGAYVSYALGSTGHVYAWGYNGTGELGNGTTTSSSTPVEVEGVGGTGVLSGVVAIVASGWDGYAVTATGHVYAWGTDLWGQLGDGTTQASTTPVEVKGVGGSGYLAHVVALAAGTSTTYALSATGGVFSWGLGDTSQLGNGSTTLDQTTPVQVKGVGGSGDLSGVVSIAGEHSTAVAVTANGHVYAWGAGYTGQLGDSSDGTSNTPVEVKGAGGTGSLSDVVAVAANYASAYALTLTGAVYSWGTNANGQLGDGTTTASSTPVEVEGLGGTGSLAHVVGIGGGSGWDAYALATPPTVTALSPATGPDAGGTSVTITGTRFTGTTAVDFGSTPASSFTVTSTTTITATSPPGTGTVTVVVTTAAGTSAISSADQFTYVAGAPAVTALTPSSGSTAGGTTVAITGVSFTGTTAVTFGTTPAASFTVTSTTTITATSPAGTGTVTVTVTNTHGTSATSSADHFTYHPAPTVTAVSPSTGTFVAGTTVTITGTNLTGATAVHFGQVPATGITVTSATQLTAVAPAGVGTVTVTVTTSGGTSATSGADQFTYPSGDLVGWGTNGERQLNSGGPTAIEAPVAVPGLSQVSMVASGIYSSVALTVTGHVYAWGTNTYGELGDGTTATSSTPVEVEGVGGTGVLSNVVAVAAGELTFYALTATGHVYAWGRSNTGQLGTGTITSSSTPVEVDGVGGTGVLSGVVAIAATTWEGFAVTATGHVFGWGANFFGQLGDGARQTSTTPVEVKGVGGTGYLSGVVTVVATYTSSYALTATGDVFAWGDGGTGQLGNRSSTNHQTTPVQVEGASGGGDLSGVVSIAATRSAAFALSSNGHVYAWGASYTGRLGDGSDGTTDVPVEVSGPAGTTGPLGSVVAVGAGVTSGYALTSTGHLYAWGSGSVGQLGDGTTTSSDIPVEVQGIGGTGLLSHVLAMGGGGSGTAYAVVALPVVTALSPTTGPEAGGTSVTITGTDLSTATAVDFGSTPASSFTVTSTTTITATSPAGTGTVTVVVTGSAGTSTPTSVDRFTYFATPVVTGVSPSTGTFVAGTAVAITGVNLTGTTTVHFGAVPATGITVTSATALTAIAPAGVGTVTVTVTTPNGTSATSSADQFTYPSGQLRAWGTNISGQLGDGTTTSRTTPVAVAGLGTVAMVASGETTTLALTSTGHLDAWGAGATGELGNGTTANSLTPVEVEGVGGAGALSNIVAVATRGLTSYALGTTGHVYAWGANGTGELGNGTTANSLTPVEVEGPGGVGDLSNIVAISAGVRYVLSLTTTGHLYAWGAGATGQLGDGTTGSSATPVEVEGPGGTGDLSSVVAVSAGWYGSLALTSTGHVYAWGTNGSGELGDGTTTTSPTPVKVVGPGGMGDLSGVVAVSVGNDFSLALTVTGHVYAWGTNSSGELGDGTTTTSPTPVEVGGVAGSGHLSDIVAVSGGAFFSLGLGSTGHLYAWGANGAGELGDGTTTNSLAPVEVEGVGGTGDLSDAVAVAGGGWNAVAMVAPLPPVVTRVTPRTGPVTGHTSVAITGSGFTGVTSVTFGTRPSPSFTVTSTTTITATAPAGTLGTVPVTVTTANGKSTASATDEYTYVPVTPGVPIVTSLTPSSGPTTGSTSVTITGSGFTGVTSVTFGTRPSPSFTVTSTTTITATAPAGTPATVPVTVTTASGKSTAPATDEYTYVPVVPTVTGVSPSAGPVTGGTSVTITGTGFLGASAVDFSHPAADPPAESFTVESATEVVAVTPPSTPGNVEVTVTTPAGTSDAGSFDYVTPAPSITKVTPSAGPVVGGTVVTLTGSGFVTGGTKVTFGGATVAVTFVSTTSVMVTAPAHAGALVTVRVTTASGTSASGEHFNYGYGSAPTVSGVSPASGPDTGGTIVTITGTNFTGTTEVMFGRYASPTFKVTSSTTITATSPAGGELVTVKVITPYGSGGGGRFSYFTATGFTTTGAILYPGYAHPGAIAVDPTTDTLFVADDPDETYPNTGRVSIIDGATKRIIGGIHDRHVHSSGIAVDSATNTAYVNSTGHIIAINGATGAVSATFYMGGKSPTHQTCDLSWGDIEAGIAVDPVTDTVYAVDMGSTTLSVINGATDEVVATVSLSAGDGIDPGAVTVDPTTDMIYVANYCAGTVSVVNGATNEVVQTINVEPWPRAIAVDPVTNVVYVAGTLTVSVINGSTDVITHEVTLQRYDANAVAVDPTTDTVFVADGSLGTTGLSVIDGETNALTATLKMPSSNGVAVDPVTDTVFLSHSSTISVVETGSSAAAGPGTGVGTGRAPVHKPTCTCADPVNAASGNFAETSTDATTGGQGTATTLTRTYNSLRAGDNSIFGYGWSSSYAWSLRTANTKKTATVTETDGSSVTATETTSSGTYDVPSWADSTLTRSTAGTWTFVRHQGTTYEFNSSGQLTSVTDLAGNTTTFTYSSGKLTSVTGSGGKEITLTYNSTGLVATVTAPSGTVTYSYATGNLTSVVGPTGTTTYAYNTAHELTQITAPGDQVITNTYDAEGRVTAQTAPDGEATTFSYSGDAFSSYGGTTTITGPTGHTEVQHYVDGELTTLTAGSGTATSVTTDYAFDPTTFGETSKGVSGQAPATATYNAEGEVMTSTDADGNVTAYAYTTATDSVPAGLRYCTVSSGEHAAGVTCPAYGSTRAGVVTETFNSAGDEVTSTTARGNTTHYASTTSADDVPAGLRYCTVSPTEWAKGVTCPAYGTTAAGATTTTFDAAGNETSSTTPAGATTTTCYLGDSCAPGTATGPDGAVYKVTSPSGTTTTDTYDTAGQVIKQVVAYHDYSATTAYSYDAAGHQVCEVSPNDYAAGTRCPSSTPTPSSPPTGVTSTFYGSTGRVTKSVGPTGATTLTAYDPAGQAYCSVAPTAVANGATCPAYSGITTPTAGSDPYLGATIDLTNALGEKTTEASPLGAVTTYSYDAEGRVTSATVATGTAGAPSVTTTTSYDAAGNPTSTTTGSTTTDTAYDPTGTAYCTVSGNAEANGDTCPTWDASWLTTPPAPSSVPAGVTLTVSDPTGDTIQQTTPDGGTTVTAYNATGQVYCSVSAVNVKKGTTCPATPPTSAPTGTKTGYTTTLYNATGQVTSVTTPAGTTTTTTYDPAGLKATVKKGSATTTYCHYGDSCASGAPAGGGTATDLYSTTRPPSQKEATGEVTTETYTPTGQATTTVTPAVTTTDTYNDAGQLTGVAYSTVASGYANPGNVTTTYNATGTVASVATATGTTTDSYDSAGDLTSQSFTPATGSHLSASSVGYAYYPTGATKAVTYPSYGTVSDPTATYTYDTSGEMASVTDWLGHTTTFTNDHSGDVTSTAYPNSTTDAETYDTTGQVSGISLSPTGHSTSPVATIGYTRNATEQVTKETDAGDLSNSLSYTYDASSRLATTGTETVAYDTRTDPSTLPTGATPTYDTAGELTSSTKGSATTTYTYDTIGARTKVDPTTGPTTTYGVNALGQMTSAKSSASTGPLSGTGVDFTYGATGVPVGKTTNAGSTATFVWGSVGANPELLAEGATDFLYGPTGHVVEQIDAATTTPTYLVADQLGSTRLLTDQAGTVTGTYSFDAYGNVTSHTGTATTPIGYAGGFETTTTGLVGFQHRWLTAETASWLTVDPMVDTTTQPYQYADEDPTNATDPSGLYSYLYSWNLGELGAPLTVFSYFSTHVHTVFPFTTGSCGSFYLGEHCTFHPATTTDHLHVSYMTRDSVTLTVTTWCQVGWRGHVCLSGDPKGSTIHFFIYTADVGGSPCSQRTDILSQEADATGAGLITDRVAPMLAESTWEQQAKNLERALGGNPNDVTLIPTRSSPPTFLGYHV